MGSNRELSGLSLRGKFMPAIKAYREKKRKRQSYSKNRFIFSEGEAKPLVSVILLNRNGMDKLKILLRSFHRCRFYDNLEIVFVDNASTDGSVDYMKSWESEFRIVVIQNERNMTFSEGNNLGVKQAKGEYLLFLNNDTEVTDGWLDTLLRVMYTEEKPGAVGAKLVYPKIPDDAKNAGKSYRIQHAGIGFKEVRRDSQYFIQPYNLGNGQENYRGESGTTECACVTAAVLLVKKTVFNEIGGFDEKYIYGYEDVDFCLKLVKAGYHNYYCADCLVFHYEFGTQNQDDARAVEERRHHNMEVFKGKWQRFLFRTILKEKLGQRHIFTEAVLKVVIAAPLSGFPAISYYEEYLKHKQFIVKYITARKEPAKYKISIEADILLSFDSDYDISQIVNAKHDLIKIACISGKREIWENKPYFDCYDDEIAVVDNGDEQTVAQGMKKLEEILYGYTENMVNDHEIDICGAMTDYHGMVFWGDYHFATALQREFEKKGFRANVLARERWYDRSTAKYTLVLRGLKPYYPSVEENRVCMMWNISHPQEVTITEYNLFDAVFFASEKMEKRLAAVIKPPAFVLLQCTDEKVMSYQERGKKQYELLFVGNSRKVFRPILKDLLPTEYKLSVYGKGWEEYPVKDYVVSEYLDNDKVGQAYHDAEILLNDHWEDMKEYGIISNRIFDALAAKAFVISDDLEGLREVLQDTVVTYRDAEDLKEKIGYYLQHEEERDEKAKLGQQIVLAQHTFVHRVRRILEIMVTL
ncbi:MAG: glycosyltransferase [Bacteroidales bacterium]|nr:glycosyltransferase [Clostridium sp.]MCM1202911.1 glycosyltransferase [Bacteroidales bacterium]